MKTRFLAAILIVTAGVAAGAFWLRQRFLHDRQAALGFQPPVNHRMVQQTTTTSDGKTVHTYTARELEEARRKGKFPKGMEASNIAQTNAANQAAVQRQLQTIEEINRINAMNQRLIEEQQRMQKQNK